MKILDYIATMAEELARDKFIVVPTAYAAEIASMLTKRMCIPVMGGSLSMDMRTRCLYID